MELRDKMRRRAARVFKAGFPFVAGIGLMPRRVVVRMDGGICSQMHFYLIGDEMARRGNDVMFDTSWFREWGKDMNGVYARNFDLLTAFPGLKGERARFDFTPVDRMVNRVYRDAAPREVDWYDPAQRDVWLAWKAPVYMMGYYHLPEDSYKNRFRELFKVDYSQIEGKNREVLDRIVYHRERAVAMHVRRGDLSTYNKAYGNPVTKNYLIEAALAQVRDIGTPRFYIFSDEPRWCRQELIPELKRELPAECSVELVDNNGSERGWLDLFLMSQCSGIIASKGSMGKYAALMRGEDWEDGLVVLSEDRDAEVWEGRFPYTQII